MPTIDLASVCGNWLSVRNTPTSADAATSSITTAVCSAESTSAR